jgi:predicted dehydrogenase
MTQNEIRVGIVGANAENSWAKVSHVPAIKGLPGLRLAAVATRNERSAREAAQAFGAERWSSDPFVMIQDDQIDVVTIAVKVPSHRELVLAALEQAKRCSARLPSDAPSRRLKRWPERQVHFIPRSDCKVG